MPFDIRFHSEITSKRNRAKAPHFIVPQGRIIIRRRTVR
ncbi:hypothetical protein Daudx_1968 [Candidatus Desulforudis audaxviator]|nr:hypothetical protein Daudx_1968 [Candidatus Desulforudis audaxviator]